MKRQMVKAILIAILAVFLTSVFGSINNLATAKEWSKTFRVAEPFPPKSFPAKIRKWWASELEKRTNGRAKVKFFWMGSLVKWKDMLHGVSSGVAEIGCPNPTYHPTDLALYMLTDMPYNGTDYWAGMMACIDTATKEPGLKSELERNNLKYLAPWCGGAFYMQTRRPWNSLSELKGKTFRSYGGAWINYLEILGINPIFMSYGQIYEALDRGTVDGNGSCVLQLSDALKHYEVGVQATYMNNGYVLGGSSLSMNLDVWKQLPKDIQNIMDQLCIDTAAYFAKELKDIEMRIADKWKNKNKVIMNELSPQDKVISRNAGMKAQEQFLNKLESQGKPARKTWNYFQAAMKKYEEEVKTKGHPWERK